MFESERINNVIMHYKMNKSAFSRYIGLSTPQILYDVINKKTGISKNLAEIITRTCLDIDKAWLLTGEGSMLKSDNSTQKESSGCEECKKKDWEIQSLRSLNEELKKENKELIRENGSLENQITTLNSQLDMYRTKNTG